MSVKPGTTSKKTVSINNVVSSETMNPPTPLPYGRHMDATNYATVYENAVDLNP